MNVPINAKRLWSTLPDVVERVRKGTRFTVISRSRPAFQIVPVDDQTTVITTDDHFRQVGFDVLPAVRRQTTRQALLIELSSSIRP
jgi:prevent-host-death family protein